MDPEHENRESARSNDQPGSQDNDARDGWNPGPQLKPPRNWIHGRERAELLFEGLPNRW